nr:hypothetical protein [Micromonospora tarapacensis]
MAAAASASLGFGGRAEPGVATRVRVETSSMSGAGSQMATIVRVRSAMLSRASWETGSWKPGAARMAISSTASSRSNPPRWRPVPEIEPPSPTLTTQQRVPPLSRKPKTARASGVLSNCSPSAYNRRKSVQLFTARASPRWAVRSGATPTKPAVLVPTGPIGRAPLGTSST